MASGKFGSSHIALQIKADRAAGPQQQVAGAADQAGAEAVGVGFEIGQRGFVHKHGDIGGRRRVGDKPLPAGRLARQIAQLTPDIGTLQPALPPQIHPGDACPVGQSRAEMALMDRLRVCARRDLRVVSVVGLGIGEKRLGIVFHQPQLAAQGDRVERRSERRRAADPAPGIRVRPGDNV